MSKLANAVFFTVLQLPGIEENKVLKNAPASYGFLKCLWNENLIIHWLGCLSQTLVIVFHPFGRIDNPFFHGFPSGQTASPATGRFSFEGRSWELPRAAGLPGDSGTSHVGHLSGLF